MRIPPHLARNATSARRWLGAVLLALAPGMAMAFGSVGTCPPDFGALREMAEQVRNPTTRASALDFARSGVALSVYRAGGLEAFVERQRELMAAWRDFPGDALFEPDRAAMIALHGGAIDIAGCVQRQGDPRLRVDRQAAANRELAAVVAVQSLGRDERLASGSGVLVSPCHVLTSQHVVSGMAAPKRGQRVTVMPSMPIWSAIRGSTGPMPASSTIGRCCAWRAVSMPTIPACRCCRAVACRLRAACSAAADAR